MKKANTSLSKDLDTKRKTYACASIKEYWVVDLKHRLVKVFRNPVDENYIEEITLTNGEISPIAIERNKGFGKNIIYLISFI